MDETDDICEKVKSLTEKAIVHMISGNSKGALECYRDAFKLSLDVGTPQQVLSCVCNYGASCLVNNKSDEAISLLEEHIAKVEGVEGEDDNFFTLKGDVHYNLALAYNIKSQYELAITNLTCAIQIFESKSITKTLAESYQQLGDICVKCGKKEEAVEAYSQAARTFKDEQDSLSEGKIYMKLAKMHWDEKETVECLKRLQKCEKICVLLKKDASAKATKLLFDLALMYKKLKESGKALRWLKYAAEKNHHNPSDEDVKIQAVVAQNLGKMYIETRDYNRAVEMYLKAAAFFGQLGNTKSRAWCFYHLGGIFLMLKDSRNAEKNYHVAYQMLEDSGSVNHLWKIKEGLGDLYAVTYQYAKSVTYYKESLALIGIHSSRHVRKDERRIVEKLSAVLDSQRNGGKRDIHISYNSRKPVVLPLNIESTLEYSSVGLPPKPSNGPATSTPLGREGRKTRHSKRDGRRKKGKKRQDLLHAPVPNGVTNYESGSDLSLMEKEMQKQLSLSCSMRSNRSFSLPKNLENTYEIPVGDKGEIGMSNCSASQVDLSKESSQGAAGRGSRDEDDGSMKEERKRSWNIFRSRRKKESTDGNEDSSSDSDSDSDSASMSSHQQQSTSGTQTIPLYATISKTNGLTGELSANYFSDTYRSTSGDHMSSTIPSRWAPDPPGPPTLPPMEHHPSILKRVKNKSESSASETDNNGMYPDTLVMSNMTRAEREAGLYEASKEEEEFWKQQHSSPHHLYRKSVEERRRSSVRNSRMCLVM